MNSNFALIFTCLVVGVLLRLSRRFPERSAQSFNAYVIWVALPATILLQIPALLSSVSIDAGMLLPISMAWILFALSAVFFYFVGCALKWSKAAVGALVLTGGLGNTSFVGFPLLESFYGAEGLRVGVLVDQPGTFLVLSTLGLVVATYFSPQTQRHVSAAGIVKNILKFPPFVALLVALIWYFSGIYSHEGAVHSVLERLSSTLVPLALVGVGFQLKVSGALLRRQWRPLIWGLGFKLLLAPLFFVGLYMLVLGQHNLTVRMTILEAAMAPMITASVVAEECGLDAEIASLMVGVGIPVSLLTVYAWNAVLSA